MTPHTGETRTSSKANDYFSMYIYKVYEQIYTYDCYNCLFAILAVLGKNCVLRRYCCSSSAAEPSDFRS